MNYKIFEEVTRIDDNGKRIGIPVNEKPKYVDKMKQLREDFNRFTQDICPENWKLYKVGRYWQMGTPLGSTYKPYFWNQFKHQSYNIDGISIWIKIDSNRIGIMFGTTGELKDYNADDINKLIWERYSNKNYDFFEKTQTDAYLNYNYIGNDEYKDLWQVGLNINYNLFDFGVRKREYIKSVLEKKKVIEEKRKVSLEIKNKIREALNNIKTAEADIKASKRRLQYAKEVEDIEKTKYMEGVSSLYDYLKAKSYRYLAESDYYKALYDKEIQISYLKYLLEEFRDE